MTMRVHVHERDGRPFSLFIDPYGRATMPQPTREVDDLDALDVSQLHTLRTWTATPIGAWVRTLLSDALTIARGKAEA